MVKELHFSQPLSQTFVDVGVVRKHNWRDRLRDKLPADVEECLRFSHAGQSNDHQVWVRFAGHRPFDVGTTECVSPENDPCNLRRFP